MKERTGRVLVIDDNELIRRLATTLLSKKQLEVATANNGRQGLEQAIAFKPDVILLDVMMPEMDGIECCRLLKNNDATRDIPVIMISSNTDTVDKIKGFEIGAADYVDKPFNYGELLARVVTQVRGKHLLNELAEKNSQLEELVKKDSLTNLYNHRYFHERLATEFNLSLRYATPLSCIVCDIDHFKRINDTYGHQAGDVILVSLAELFTSSIREVDIVARYGGEEFAFILPHTRLDDAAAFAERIRATVELHTVRVNGTQIAVTLSLGIAAMPACNASSHIELIRFADEALYSAKQGGRNRVIVSDQSAGR